ncbi:MAG: DUF6431 domain-containing protein [Lachnospiraceae bacterium]
MITLYVEEYNPLTPDFYNNVIANLQFHQLRCSCGQAGCLSVHAYYHRHIKVPGGRLRFRICRVRCESCGRTHALLLSSMVPYSQISLKDQVTIIDAFESKRPTAYELKKLDSVDESNFRYVIRQYLRHWKQRLLAERIPILPVSDLVRCCLHNFCRQFMQIHCTPNRIFLHTT